MRFFITATLWALLADWVTATPTHLASRQAEQVIGGLQPNPVVQPSVATNPLPVSPTNPSTGPVASSGSFDPTTSQSTPGDQTLSSPQNPSNSGTTPGGSIDPATSQSTLGDQASGASQDTGGAVFNATNISPLDAANGTLAELCNAICQDYAVLQDQCQTPHCGCNLQFLSAQGYCGLCQAADPVTAATVQFLLDAETAQCRREGIDIHFQLQLDPQTQAIVDQTNAKSALLRRQQKTFLALQIVGGHVGLPIVLTFAVFSRKVRRDPTFLNFCITWIFSSIVYSLLLYGGTTDNTILNSLGEVPPNKCLAQAALTEGAQVMTAGSTLALVIRLWLGLRAAIYGEFEGHRQSALVTIGLLLAPYILFMIFGLASIFVGMHQFTIADTALQRALPTNFYCTIVEPDVFIRAVYGVTLVLLICTTLSDLYIIAILYRHWWAFRHVRTNTAVSLSLLLRVILFSLYRIVVAVAYGSVLKVVPDVDSQGEGDSIAVTFSLPIWIDMLQAAIPLVGTIVLGISNDMVSTITFWRKRESRGISSLSTMNSASTGMNITSYPFDDAKTADYEQNPNVRNIQVEV